MHTHTHTHTHKTVYIYIYIEREREREREHDSTGFGARKHPVDQECEDEPRVRFKNCTKTAKQFDST